MSLEQTGKIVAPTTMIKQLKNMWVCVHPNGCVDPSSCAYLKKNSIAQFIGSDGPEWEFFQKTYGWRCIKVNISFEEVK